MLKSDLKSRLFTCLLLVRFCILLVRFCIRSNSIDCIRICKKVYDYKTYNCCGASQPEASERSSILFGVVDSDKVKLGT